VLLMIPLYFEDVKSDLLDILILVPSWLTCI